MTRPFDKHLDSDELDKLFSLESTGVSDSGRLLDVSLREAERHVESCTDCSQKLQMHKSVHSGILRMRAPDPSPLTPGCIGDAEWLEVAAGLYPEAKTVELMKHAAQCGHCGPLLKNAAEALADETTPSEEAWLASLSSARPEWQKNMAETLRSSSGASIRAKKKEGMAWWQVLSTWRLPAFAVIALAVVAGWLGWRALHRPTADQLLAQAYTEHRTMEVRIPGAKYSPVQAQRGSVNRSDFDKPQSLLKAEFLIGENLSKNPDDPLWLQTRGRADLLDGNYDSAIKSLQRALEIQPDSPGLLSDLGSAYFVRAESADRPSDYGNAIEVLGKALAKSPNDTIALFNRALACERMFLYTQAVDDWEHYIRLDPQGGWSEEARNRLTALQEKLKKHAQRMSEALPDVASLMFSVDTPDQADLTSMDLRIDDYLDLAIRQWLPIAFSTHTSEIERERAAIARESLRGLAGILSERHKDDWLRDVMNSQPSHDVGAALQALAHAADANAAGQPSLGKTLAVLAERLFQAAGNEPGLLRAQMEELYSLHRLFRAPECLQLSSSVGRDLIGKRYAWIATQLRLEQFACFSSQARMDRGAETISSALKSADSAGYNTLSLRAMGLAATLETQEGNRLAAEGRDLEGLRRYWSGTYPPLRAYQFYDDLSDQAQREGQWHLAAALGREAVLAASTSGNRSFEAIAHFQLAISARMAGSSNQASAEYTAAQAIFASLPQTSDTRAFLADAELQLAEAESTEGFVKEAADRIAAAKANLPVAFDSYTTWLAFYRTSARISQSRANEEELRKACTAVVIIAEQGLRTILTENDRFSWSHATSSCYRSLVSAALRDNDPVSALELWEWYQGAAVRATHPNVDFPELSSIETATLPRVAEVQQHLQTLRHETVLAYAELSGQISIWVYDDRGIHWTTAPVDAKRVADIAGQFAAQCSDPASNLESLRANARYLYDWLLAPISAHLEASRTLLIEPDRILAALPFQALIEPGGSYVGWQRPIAYSPGFGYLLRLRANTVLTSSSRALVVGEPLMSGRSTNLNTLPDANKEARWVSTLFNNSVLITGRQATEGTILRHFGRTIVFHFAGHAISGPEGTGLAVTGEALPSIAATTLLGPDRIATADLRNLRLAVLSACSTGRAGEDGLAGPENLAAAFLRAGVPNVVASRWNVDSSATASFMALLYPALMDGGSPANSVLLASRRIGGDPSNSHPYFWAAFSVFGRA